MPYTKTTWVDDVTPISSTKMNKIEQGILDAVPKDQLAVVNGVATLDAGIKVPTAQIPVIPVAQLGNVIDAMESGAEVWELLAEKIFTVTGYASTSFAGIPAGYRRLKLVGHTQCSSSSGGIQLTFNAADSVYYFSQTTNGAHTSSGSASNYSINGVMNGSAFAASEIILEHTYSERHSISWKVSGLGTMVQGAGYNDTAAQTTQDVNTIAIGGDYYYLNSYYKLYGCKM